MVEINELTELTKESVVARQTITNPYSWPVVGQSNTQVPPMSAMLEPPTWWADALITDESTPIPRTWTRRHR